MSTVIEVDDVWKKYRLGIIGTGTLRHDFERWWHRVHSKPDPHAKVGETANRRTEAATTAKAYSSDGAAELGDDEVWALRGVSFEVKQGEILGIIGRNGAGKSTLLKILSRVTSPTKGEARIKGRIASLLEVGTGFHPELTGRENIFLNGAILGMTKAEIRTKLDEIVAFAEIDTYVDTPVKRYSSGMYVRLAFAVAAHLEPEILIVDEVLAVGDTQFQKKSLGKMSDVSRAGRTVLFVSHNMAAVRQLCTRGVMLNAGQVEHAGKIDVVVDAYTAISASHSAEHTWDDLAQAPGSEIARLRAVRIVDQQGTVCSSLSIDEPFYVEVDYTVLFGQPKLNLSVSLFTSVDTYVLASASTSDRDWYQQPHEPGNYRGRCKIPASLLNHGQYYITALLVENGIRVIAQADKVVSVEMVDSNSDRGGYLGCWGGVIRPSLQWETTLLNSYDACE